MIFCKFLLFLNSLRKFETVAKNTAVCYDMTYKEILVSEALI